jgi:glycosyltransferase involved in cell wall biosynthesis
VIVPIIAFAAVLGKAAIAVEAAAAKTAGEAGIDTITPGHSQPLMHVLHVIPSISLEDGGPARAIRVIERALRAAGAGVTVLTTDFDGRRLGAPAQGAIGKGAERVIVRRWTNVYKIAPGAVPWLWRNVRRFHVVHIHALFSFVSVIAGAIAFARGVPFVIRPLGTLAHYGVTRRRPLLKRLSITLVEGPLLRRAAFVHCTSRPELAEAQSLGIPFRGGVIPLGIERPAIQVEETRTTAGDEQKILFLSRIDPKKNIEGLLRAFALVSRRCPAAVLLIAGSGPSDYVAKLESEAEELAIADRVHWLGYVEGDRKDALLASADLFVLPSFSENFGIAVVEAMLAGIPCVLSRGVGIAEESVAAGGSVVVAPEPEAIAGAIIDLLEDGDRRRDMGQNARVWSEREFSTETMATRLIDLYATLSSQSRTA